MYDDGSDYTFNIYLCNRCGTICKKDIWVGKGNTWVYINNSVKREKGD